jgi:hypothetical protein
MINPFDLQKNVGLLNRGIAWCRFDGDGMVHACRIKDGKVSYSARLVQTNRLKRELDLKYPVYQRVRHPFMFTRLGSHHDDKANMLGKKLDLMQIADLCCVSGPLCLHTMPCTMCGDDIPVPKTYAEGACELHFTHLLSDLSFPMVMRKY